MTHPARLPIEQLLTNCRLQRQRRSGPGGQHRNKVETAVVVEHLPSGVRAEASERRSQEQNRRVAVRRLRVKLALALREAPMPEPSEAWRQRAAGGRISIRSEHEDYPALLAEALDVVHAHHFDMSAAAAYFDVTASQLTKLLKSEPSALNRVNRERDALGLAPLR